MVLRGIDRQTIFDDKEDNETFLQSLYGYCLLGNHVHLLLKEGLEEFVKVMKQNSDEKCLENEEKSRRLADEELIVMTEKRFRMKAKMIQNESRTAMEYLLKEILEIEGVSNSVIWRL